MCAWLKTWHSAIKAGDRGGYAPSGQPIDHLTPQRSDARPLGCIPRGAASGVPQLVGARHEKPAVGLTERSVVEWYT